MSAKPVAGFFRCSTYYDYCANEAKDFINNKATEDHQCSIIPIMAASGPEKIETLQGFFVICNPKDEFVCVPNPQKLDLPTK